MEIVVPLAMTENRGRQPLDPELMALARFVAIWLPVSEPP